MKRRIISIVTIVVLATLALLFYYRYYFVFGEGVKAGNMNYFVYKGYVFKTYEGKLIQNGLKTQLPGTVQSNEFMFSVTDPKVAAKLNQSSGAMLELHYKEYLHTLPWRGVSNFVVDSIVAIKAQ